MKTLNEMLAAGAGAAELAAHLDPLDHAERVAQVRSLSRRNVRQLYHACDGHAASINHFVPANVGAGQVVRHYGINSLPLARLFEKRFQRAPAGAWPDGRLWGYNEQKLKGLTGPGYFVVDPAPDGEQVAINYEDVPPAAPDGWPPLKRNEAIPSRWIYGFTLDWMRRVSQHVSVGHAYRNGRPIHAYFALVREESPAGSTLS